MARRLGAWDCPYCQEKGIPGNVFTCPGCEVPRPKGIRFYRVPNGTIVTPEIAEQLGSGGPNWYCEHCDSSNKDNATECWKCGAPKGNSPSHEVKNYKQGQKVPTSTEEAARADSDGQAWVAAKPKPAVRNLASPPTNHTLRNHLNHSFVGPDSTKKGAFRSFVFSGGVVLGILAITFLIYQLFFRAYDTTVQISSFHWTQNVEVSEYQTISESSWTSHPTNAYNIESSYLDTGEDEKVHDGWVDKTYTDTCTESEYVSETCYGTTDLGDGSFDTYEYECGGYETSSYSCEKTRQVEIFHYEDVFDNYYEYDIDKWLTIAQYPTSGYNRNPYYSNSYVLVNEYFESGTPQLGQQKDVLIPGRYSITFYCSDNSKVGAEGAFTVEYPQNTWRKFEENTNYEIEINSLNKILTNPVP